MVDVSKISLLRRSQLARRALMRMVRITCPEQQLWLRVIAMAVEDMVSPGPNDAHRYFTRSFPFEVHADLAGLDPDAVRLVLKQAHLIGSTQAAAA